MRDLLNTVDIMTDEEAGIILKAIINHVDGEDVKLSRELTFAFAPIQNQLNRDLAKYDVFVDKQRKNGALGGRPKKPKTNPNNPSLYSKTQKTQANPNNLVTDNVTVNDTVNDTVNVTVTETANDNKKRKTTRFATPSLNQINDYVQEKSYHINGEVFFNHYESNGWKVGKNPMKSWKAALANWNSRENKNGSQVLSQKEQFYADMQNDTSKAIDGECHVVK